MNIENETERGSVGYEYETLMRLLRVSASKHLIDEHYTLIWANDFYYELIGWPKDEYEAVFHNRPDLYYADDPEGWKELVAIVTEAVRENRNGYSFVGQMKRRSGEKIWVKFSTAFSDEYVDGCRVSYTTMTDIDEFVRVQTEQSIAYNNLPGFVAKFRMRGDGFELVKGYDRFCAFFGCRGDAVPSFGLTNVDSEKNREAFAENIPIMKRGEPAHFTLQALDEKGRDIWLQVNADCIERMNGDPVYLVIYIDVTDLTEQRALQKKLEERTELLNKALEEAERANMAKSEFLSRMSHDIRTPLNAVIGMTAIAASHIDDRDRVMSCLNKITVSSRLLLSLINEVLDMSRIESGRLTIGEEAFNWGELLNNIVTVIQPSVMEKRHSFDVRAFGLFHENVLGDPQRIQQILLNVLSNAVKYTPDGGSVLFEIREKPYAKEGFALYEFVVTDNGYGMKPAFLRKVFAPFERSTEESIRAIQGTGLGMAISRRLARHMEGDITVESVYGAGSTFTVTVPLRIRSDDDDRPLSVSLPVLVADDDELSCETTCDRLRELGIDSRAAHSGAEAVAAARKVPFAAFIVDLVMPGMNGIETARLIRERDKQTPIILISAYDWLDYETEAVAAGVNGFIIKPILKSSLKYAVRKYLNKEDVRLTSMSDTIEKPTLDGRRLLLVEDNDFNREIAVELLGQTGARVDCAVNGKEAVERFAASPCHTYDLVFMDLQMPVMDGLTATRSIRALDRADAETTPIVAMTANAFTEDVEATRAAGMNAHLPKPLDIAVLYRTMREFLGGAKE